jgi:hypothetical protein
LRFRNRVYRAQSRYRIERVEAGEWVMSIVGKRGAKKQAQARGKAREALDLEWLRKHEQQGRSVAVIAAAEGVSRRTVQLALARARDADRPAGPQADPDADLESRIRDSSSAPKNPWWLELVPLFPIGAFTPTSKCPHHGPIRPGSLFCCMVCSASGIDDHPALKRDPETDPRPEPSTRTPSAPTAPTKSTSGANPSSPLAPAGDRETRKERRRRQFRAAGAERGTKALPS